MKKDSILEPETGPFGLTRGKASVRAMVAASRVNNPGGVFVETVVTVLTRRRGLPRRIARRALDCPSLLGPIRSPRGSYAFQTQQHPPR